MGNLEAVEESIRAFNKTTIEDLCRETELIHTPRGAIYEVGGAHARALFHDRQGQAYADAVLVMESLDLPPEDSGWVEVWLEAYRLTVVSLSRGRHLARVVELRHLGQVLGDVLPQPANIRLAHAKWARSWSTPPSVIDREALAIEGP
ncbi:hypothetical protein [Actinacidiphila oryziradicis]|uniref:Uncharacterized protein n=1 Tax=Actinacidiphila oryziradicis TaxID=2571141 RepID=A0A4U0RZU7_9ACTN|nr:hypothetical protein [Actinacidiphila oryziradicis]TKA01992.1 hypothetical protein FCI23_39680 [Actinacidiphila oryziradicis]